MFTLSTKSDYGLLLLSLLAKKNSKKENYASISSIAKKSKLPLAFVSRIASELSAVGILESKEGISGGYRLAKDPSLISVAQVVEILEGSLALTKCTKKMEKCEYETICPMAGSWQKTISGQMYEVLRRYTLKDLMDRGRR